MFLCSLIRLLEHGYSFSILVLTAYQTVQSIGLSFRTSQSYAFGILGGLLLLFDEHVQVRNRLIVVGSDTLVLEEETKLNGCVSYLLPYRFGLVCFLFYALDCGFLDLDFRLVVTNLPRHVVVPLLHNHLFLLPLEVKMLLPVVAASATPVCPVHSPTLG